jgi:hypothetical protein
MVQTVIKEKYEAETLEFENTLNEEKYIFEVYGQTVDRSYEDRDVYFRFSEHGWLRGEDAIKLGQALIKHGTNALIANMINHQAIHEQSCFKRLLAEGRVQKVTMKVVDEHPANYGSGFRTYLVKPEWVSDKAPQYQEDFQFEVVIYWSPFEDEYKKQIQQWGGDLVVFEGYDREAELKAFQESCNAVNAAEGDDCDCNCKGESEEG